MTATIYVPIAPGADPSAEQHRAELLAEIYPPKAKAQSKRRDHATITAEWMEDILWLIDNGVSVAGVCQSLHSTPAAIGRRLERNGRPDLSPMFERYAR